MKRGEIAVKVLSKKQVALDAVSVELDFNTAELQKKFKFKPGQFIGITQNINGEEVHRSYSISSDPANEKSLVISIKKIPGGLMSTFLVDELSEGDTILATPPSGHFYKESENQKHHVMFAAGSGVTPMMSVLYHLMRKPKDKVSLFYWNQSPKGTMFLKELQKLNEENKNFNLFLAYTRSSESPSEVFCNERVNQENLKTCFYNWNTSLDMPVFYLCGPTAFMDEISIFLGQKGYDGSQVRKESFHIEDLRELHSKDEKEDGDNQGAQTQKSTELLIGDLSQLNEKRGGECLAALDDEELKAEVKADETILEAFLRSGESPPYSCMEGTCMACQCKVVEGVVEMPLDSFLSEQEIQDKNILSCQAFVRSKTVKVDFDDF